jgi:hypothetical protein
MGRPSWCAASDRILAPAAALVAAILALVGPAGVSGQEGDLQTIRDDVRQGPPPSAAPSDDERPGRNQRRPRSCDDGPQSDGEGGYGALACVTLVGAAVTSPIWAPITILGDDYGAPGRFFPRFPYDECPGYLTIDECLPQCRPWAARLEADYVDDLDRIASLGGRLLLESDIRVGSNGPKPTA